MGQSVYSKKSPNQQNPIHSSANVANEKRQHISMNVMARIVHREHKGELNKSAENGADGNAWENPQNSLNQLLDVITRLSM